MTDEGYTNMMREAAENRISAEVERQEYNLVSILGLVPKRDGDKWFVLWGDDLTVGISGFGDTPYKAILAFNKAVFSERGAA